MNKLSTEQRAKVLHRLCEGSSVRSITRLLSVGENIVPTLMIDVEKACPAYNFTRIHKTLRVTLAMEAGITGHVWDGRYRCA